MPTKTENKLSTSRLIAHRGYSSHYPENTLCAIRAALECGACYVECDVQLTKDKVPVLLHDNDLSRISGVSTNVDELNYAELQEISAGFEKKFGQKFEDENIPSLEAFVDLLKEWPERKAFVEIKRSSIRLFGMDTVLQKILPLLQGVSGQVVVISFDADVIDWLIAKGGWKTGWVVEEWSDAMLDKVTNLDPDYLFVDAECLPADHENFKQSRWHWVLYEVDDPLAARELVQQGAEFIESNDIKRMLESGVFMKSTCVE